jgi:hypothetical protein
MTKTVSIEGTDYTLAPITVEAAEKIQLNSKSGLQFNIALVAASLVSGGDTSATEATVRALPFYAVFAGELLPAAREVNGLTAPKAQAKAEAAQPESTSDTSSSS